MERVLHFLALSLGGWLGWALGSMAGLLPAMALSAVGSGVGLWMAIRLGHEWL